MSLHTLGTPKPGNYDPTLVDRLNKAAEEEARKARQGIVPKAARGKHARRLRATFYKGLWYETIAPICKEDSVQGTPFPKRLYNFNDSLQRLRRAGYYRHMLPAEYYELMLHRHEGSRFVEGPRHFPKEAEELGNDMCAPQGEWFDLVLEHRLQHLTFYEHPRRIFVNSRKGNEFSAMYAADRCGFTYPAGVTLRGATSLEELRKHCPDVIQYLWSRRFEDIPQSLHNFMSLYIPMVETKVIPWRATTTGPSAIPQWQPAGE